MRAEYEKAPQVTRQRLYIDSMEKVLSNSSKVLIDVNGSNMMYLPLDKIISNAQSAPVKVQSTFTDSSIKQAPSSRSSERSTVREAR
jgi:membrane protease subunit HflK